MTNIITYKTTFLLEEADFQIVVFSPQDGLIIDSCDNLFKFLAQKKQSLYDTIPFLESLRDVLQQQNWDKLHFPMMSFGTGNEHDRYNFTFKRNINEFPDAVVWIIQDLSKYMHYLTEVHQDRRVAMLENEKLEIENRLAEIEHTRLEEKMQTEALIFAMEQDRIEEQLSLRERELTTTTMYLTQRNDLMRKIRDQLYPIMQTTDKNTQKNLAEIYQEIGQMMRTGSDWEQFKKHFEQVHPRFFDKIMLEAPNLQANDLKLCAYIRLRMNIKEISMLLNINPQSVKNAKNRLKKKINLDDVVSLDDWIAKM